MPDIAPPGEGAVISGRVVERDVKSGEDVPVAGARVLLESTSFSANTDDRGTFRVSRVPLGRYRVSIERAATRDLPAAARRIAGVEALIDGQTVDLGLIELRGTGDLSGQVSLSDRDDEGAAEGALVVAAGAAFRTIVGRDGSFLLARLPEGSFDVAVFATGYLPARAIGVEVSAGEERALRPFALAPGVDDRRFPLESVVRLAGRDDSSGVSVAVLDAIHTASAAVSAETAADGRFKADVPAGVYRVRFTKAGFVPVELVQVAVLPEGVLGISTVTMLEQPAGDLDGDGLPDDVDSDRDQDGCPDAGDSAPSDPFVCRDLDADGLDDALDTDDDGDRASDAEETAPGRDGVVTDPEDSDSDDDGAIDGADVCPTISDPDQRDTDGDGVGDACDEEPQVHGFLPARGGAGAVITIRGARFNARSPELNFVRFGRGVGFAVRATARELDVRVPADAESGPIIVQNGFGSATSSASFTFVPPPRVYRFDPARASVGATILVSGAYFAAAAALEAFVGSTPAATRAITVIDPDARPPTEMIEVVVPMTSGGPIRIVTEGGEAVSAERFEVLRPPSILGISPNPAVIGYPIAVTGIGFMPAADGDEVEVELGGGVVVRRTRDQVHDTSILITVPAGARTGRVRVRRSGGEATSPDDLVIDPQAPAIAEVRPQLARAGETVEVIGANLEGTTEISFGGAVTSTAIRSVTSLQVMAVVPAGARPGPVVITSRAGNMARTATSPMPLRLLAPRRTSAVLGADVLGSGFDGQGTRVYALSRLASGAVEGAVLDAETLGPDPAGSVTISGLTGRGAGAAFQVAPGGRYGVLTLEAPETLIVDLPSFTVRSACEDGIVVGDSDIRYRFDSGGRFAYGLVPESARIARRDGVFRVDLVNASCALLADEPIGRSPLKAVLPHTAGQILVSRNGSALIPMISDPSSPLDGTYLAPLGGDTTRDCTWPFLDPDGRSFWCVSAALDTHRLGRDAPARTSLSFPRTQARGILAALQSADLRWLLHTTVTNPAGSGHGLAFIDLERDTLARHTAEVVDTAYASSVHPTRPVFIAREPSRAVLVREEIIE